MFEVGAAVSELQASVIAVAGLVAQILDDGVDGRLLDDTRRVPARAAELRLLATPTIHTPHRQTDHPENLHHIRCRDHFPKPTP